MHDYTNIFKDGVLVDVDVRFWSASKVLKAEDLGLDEKDVVDAFKLGKKMLIPAEVIRSFRAIEARARRVVEGNSFPFPIGNARFIPKKKFPEVHKRLTELQGEYMEKVDTLISEYDKHRKEMLPIYREAAKTAFINQSPTTHTFGPDYDRDAERRAFVRKFIKRIESYYPDAESLRSRFSLDWNVFEIAMPRMKQAKASKVAKIEGDRQFAEAEYHRQIQQKMSVFIDDVIRTMRQETMDVCNRVITNIKEGKVIRSDTIDSIKRFVDRFSSLNFVGDVQIETQLSKLQTELLDAYHNTEFNNNVDLKETLGRRLGELADLASDMTDINSITGNYRRKVVWRDDEPSAKAA